VFVLHYKNVGTIGNSTLRWALYFSEVVPSWGQSIEVSPIRSRTPRLRVGRSGGAIKLPQRVRAEPASNRILVHFRHTFAPFWVPKMMKNFLCFFSIKRMWELLGTLRSRWALYLSEVVRSWGQSIEMSLPLEVAGPSIALRAVWVSA